MIRADRLLRLYPRAWRERYGEEFLALVGESPLRPQQMIDIIAGAVDAWMSADVRGATGSAHAGSNGGGLTVLKSLKVCEQPRYTTRDALIGSGVMICATLLFTLLGFAARRNGWQVTGEVMMGTSFPASLTLSMPFWMMKGLPWRVQAVIVGGTLVFLVAIGYLASLI